MNNEKITVTLDKSAYEFLKEFMHKIDTQDRFGTAKPVLYKIQTDDFKIVHDDHCEQSCWFDCNGNWNIIADDIEELRAYLKEENKDRDEEDRVDIDNMSDWDIEVLAEECGYKEYPIKRFEEFYETIFLTREKCEEYIKYRSYRLGKNPRLYCDWAGTDNEFAPLFNALSEITKGEVE